MSAGGLLFMKFGTKLTVGMLLLTCATITVASSVELSMPMKDIVSTAGFPKLGKWMIGPDGTYAHWLGVTHRGKKIREPINVLLVDAHATSVEDAKKRLLNACAKAGYLDRMGHSSGYFGFISDKLYGQYPGEKGHAFSNEPFEFNNNHGRVFGPAFENGKYYFVGALSRELVAPLQKVKHVYGSFNQARDNFVDLLDSRTQYKIARFIQLDNALIGDAEWTTGDHDGVAVVVEAGE